MRKIDYDSGYKKMIAQNLQEVRDNIDTKDMKIKIENYCTRYGLPYAFVRRKILMDNIFAIAFAKDPSKQSFHQHCAADFIKQLPNVEGFAELPAGGTNALFVLNGCVVNKASVPDSNDTKSIDFHWSMNVNNKPIHFYAAHKHTDQEGGAQDNQYNDLKAFMKHGQKNTAKNVYFLAIGDGPYYQRLKEREGTATRLEFMNQVFGNDHCIALTSDDIEALMNKIIL